MIVDALNLRLHAQEQVVPTGFVTSLPSSPVAGQQIVYKAAASIYWNLIYTDESAEYPWNKIGGPPLRKAETTEPACTEAFKTEGAPAITLPAVKMQFDASFGATMGFSTGTFSDGQMVPFVNEVEQEDRLRLFVSAAGSPVHHKTFGLTAAASQVVRIKYKATTVTGSASFRRQYLEIDPIRVG
jgi:hypothetical protein